mmetsp:Transcript_3600/g.6649  ORF Transcript_3600/g.6649 Transcript_3600/m.6649 type:complete len:238 (+) Transcript_3600:282-995(+)
MDARRRTNASCSRATAKVRTRRCFQNRWWKRPKERPSSSTSTAIDCTTASSCALRSCGAQRRPTSTPTSSLNEGTPGLTWPSMRGSSRSTTRRGTASQWARFLRGSSAARRKRTATATFTPSRATESRTSTCWRERSVGSTPSTRGPRSSARLGTALFRTLPRFSCKPSARGRPSKSSRGNTASLTSCVAIPTLSFHHTVVSNTGCVFRVLGTSGHRLITAVKNRKAACHRVFGAPK